MTNIDPIRGPFPVDIHSPDFDDLDEVAGTYLIRCAPAGKVYAGASLNLRARMIAHASAMRRQAGTTNPHVLAAVREHGSESFTFEVASVLFGDERDLAEEEQRLIASLGAAAFNHTDARYSRRRSAAIVRIIERNSEELRRAMAIGRVDRAKLARRMGRSERVVAWWEGGAKPLQFADGIRALECIAAEIGIFSNRDFVCAA